MVEGFSYLDQLNTLADLSLLNTLDSCFQNFEHFIQRWGDHPMGSPVGRGGSPVWLRLQRQGHCPGEFCVLYSDSGDCIRSSSPLKVNVAHALKLRS